LSTVTIANDQLGITSPASGVAFFGATVDTVLPPVLTILVYNADQGDSFTWGGVIFTKNANLSNYSYTGSTTTIPGSGVPGTTYLTDVTLGSSVTSIGINAFNGCTYLSSITIPDSVTSIGGSAFSACSALTYVTFTPTSTLESIGPAAFFNCTLLTSITIPDSVTTISSSAFQNSGLTTVTISSATATALGKTSPATGVAFFGATVTTHP